jgi:hypothetical protein
VEGLWENSLRRGFVEKSVEGIGEFSGGVIGPSLKLDSSAFSTTSLVFLPTKNFGIKI